MKLNAFDQELWDACPLEWRLTSSGQVAHFGDGYYRTERPAWLVEPISEIDGFQTVFIKDVPWGTRSLSGLDGEVIYRGTDDQTARDAAAYQFITLRREWLWSEYFRSANPPDIPLVDRRREMGDHH